MIPVEIEAVLEGKTRWCVLTADCLSPLSEMPKGSVDALVTDPPYCSGAVSESQRTQSKGQGLRSETLRRLGWFVGDNMGTAGLCFLLRSVAAESATVVKDTGSMVFFCDWRMQSSLQPAIESAGLRYQGLIVWDKQSMGLGRGFRAQHELALHFTNGAPEYHNLGTPNILRCPRVTVDERIHQTQKPVDLLRQIVEVVAPVGGVDLDTFAGSGSTGVACVKSARRFIGFELSEEHAKNARTRLREAEAESGLFAGAQ